MSKAFHLHYPPEYETDIWRHYRLKTIAQCLSSMVLQGLLLDIGCNDCAITRFLPSDRYEYLGADLSSSALKEGSHQRRILCDACFLPIKTNIIDAVICSEVIEHLEEPHSILEEIVRVLKPKGKLVISTPNKESMFLQIQNSLRIPRLHDWRYVESHFQVYSPKEFDALLEEHGFRIKKKAKSTAFPPFKLAKKQYPFRIFHTLSKAVPEDFQELLIRVAEKVD